MGFMTEMLSSKVSPVSLISPSIKLVWHHHRTATLNRRFKKIVLNTLQTSDRNFLLGHKLNVKSHHWDKSATVDDEEWRRLSREGTWRGQDALVCTLSPSRCGLLFPSSALIQDTRFLPPNSLGLPACPSCQRQCGPGLVIKYLLMSVIKLDLTKNKWGVGPTLFDSVFILFPHFKSKLCLEVCLTFSLFLLLSPHSPTNVSKHIFPSVISLTSAFILTLQSHSSFGVEVKEIISDGKNMAQAAWTRPGLTLLFLHVDLDTHTVQAKRLDTSYGLKVFSFILLTAGITVSHGKCKYNTFFIKTFLKMETFDIKQISL